MGWGRTLFLGDIGNRLDIQDAEDDIARLRSELSNIKDQDYTIRQLAQENEELKLYLAALCRLLIHNGSIAQKDLERMVFAIDAGDGKTDGKLKGGIV